ncbi:MAG: bifunctional [glutamine synthetase] adenylyltransferase/[glutamine synthetase]-adenylyl-L-tyrosine phosphorylase [Erythrobacter sp.]
MASDWQSGLERARAHAPFLARALDRQGTLAELLAAGDGEGALAWAKNAGEGAIDVDVALRREKLALATALALGDLAEAFPLTRIMAELSDFADRALDAAITAAIQKRVPDAEPAGMIALALGKQGAGELNYSSDIDPILLFDPEILPRRASDDPAEAAQRYARDISQILSANTAEGYVFRVDLRLRPNSEVSPPAVSVRSARGHYQSSALAWERAAFIRARACAGDIAAGEAFLAEIDPFIWRSALDFGAVEEVRQLTKRIRANHDGADVPGPGFNVKQGRGGIREIEFYAQTHQLIHGGRDASLRVRGTRAALDALAEAGRIDAEDAVMLGASYDRLRTIEHRLQMVEDRQTHSLPEGEALGNVAQLDGLADGAALVAELAEITDQVARCYDTLIEDDSAAPAPIAQEAEPLADTLIATLTGLGFSEPQRLSKRIAGWSDGRYQSLRSPAAQDALGAMLPSLLEALAKAADPDRALARWESVIDNASSVVNFLRLLEAEPALLEQLIAVLTLAPPLADELSQRPQLLDALIDGSAQALPGLVADLAEQMRLADEGADYEDRLDRIRQVTSETRFALGVQLIQNSFDPLDIAAALSRLAEAGMQVAVEAAGEEFAAKHGKVAGGQLLVLGLGRLGGEMLTHASDLDVVFLFTGEFDTQSNGEKPLSASHYFNRLSQRVTAALTVPTAQGALYEVDTRLRPQGAQGPLAVTTSSFAKYQAEQAWSWEHMALTRARVLVGDEKAANSLTQQIHNVLKADRDPAKLREDVLSMRTDMAAHKQPAGPLDVKLMRGGLVDAEFCVHFLQLQHGTGLHPHLGEAIDALAADGLVSDELRSAWEMQTRLLVAGRLLAPDLAHPHAAAREAMAKACGAESFEILLQNLAKARQEVATNWRAVFGETLEF